MIGSGFSFHSDDMEMTVTNGGTLKTPFFGYPLGLTVLLNPKHEDYMWGPFASAGVVVSEGRGRVPLVVPL